MQPDKRLTAAQLKALLVDPGAAVERLPEAEKRTYAEAQQSIVDARRDPLGEGRLDHLVEALNYYAKPRTYGIGACSVFIDDSEVACRALEHHRSQG